MGFFNELFGGGDAVDEAGDAQQARIIQAIDLFNDRFEQAMTQKQAGNSAYAKEMREGIAKMKEEILAGNATAAKQLSDGLDAQIDVLTKTYNLQEETLRNAYDHIANDVLFAGEDEATAELTAARDTARGDITAGRDNALTTLRSSLTNSLNAVAGGRDQASQAIASSLQRTRETYAPYIAAGQKAIERAEQLTNDPQAQLDYVQNNPFFSAMQETARDQLFANSAARGRLGTGGTLDELDKRTLLLGEELVGNAINRNTTISGQGLNAANNQVGADTNLSNVLANILNASGIAEAGLNENYAGRASALESGTGALLGELETRYGEGVAAQTNNATNAVANMGTNFAGMLGNSLFNLGLAGTNATGNYWNNLFNLTNNQTNTLAGLTGQSSAVTADANKDYSDTRASGILSGAGYIGDLLLQMGNSESSEAIGEYNAEMQGLNMLINIASTIAGFPGFGGGSQGPTSQPVAAGGPTSPLFGAATAAWGGPPNSTNKFSPYYAPTASFNPTPYTGFSVTGN